jgi:alpha-glucosidase
MKKILIAILLLRGVTITLGSTGGTGVKTGAAFESAGDFKSFSVKGNNIEFKLTNSVVRLAICDDDIARIRMSPSGDFKPDEKFVVIKYDWNPAIFRVKDKGKYISVETGKVKIKAFKSPFRFEFYDHYGNVLNKDCNEGGMRFRGKEVICLKELTATDHFFGLGQRYEESDMRGRKCICEVTREYTPVPFFMATDGYGIFFHNTWASEYDFTGNPYTFSAPGGDELDYYFFYGPDFKHILYSYSRVTGFSPLPPKWAFGLFFSRWNEEFGVMKNGEYVTQLSYQQNGQEGLLKIIESVRKLWDWPLDGIRVHSTGPDQNFYASPSVRWPEFNWGGFPSVDSMVQKLHDQHIHPLFWETPGVFGKTKMYEEGIKNNYFLMQNGKPFDVVFGFRSPPGGLVDFMNPDARKWWGKYHYFMADLGSDGVAGDWNDHRALNNLYSPSTGMYAPEFGNVYSLLFNQASWDAYRERVPDKRCINFGLVYWAGGQRYPMQGTQDSHLSGRNIWGEMMGCINLGLSGIPFRTYTDNVSRELNPAMPLTRLSQYLSLTVAGERTQIAVTGNPTADANYRNYAHLRYRLMPYIYTSAREATVTGTPMVRSLVLEYQNDPEAYKVFGQYLLGKDILIAPLWSDTTFQRMIYLPEGYWIDFFDEKVYSGGQTISYDAPIDRVPILIKSGAIIPMAPDNQSFIDEIKSPLAVHLFPDGESKYELYEDDGVSYDYEKGIYAITSFTCKEAENYLTITKSKPDGNYSLPDKDYVFCIHGQKTSTGITINGSPLNYYKSNDDLNSVKKGWTQESDGKKLLVIKTGLHQEDSININILY